jgi:Carboxypeptidase regulatory-like domain
VKHVRRVNVTIAAIVLLGSMTTAQTPPAETLTGSVIDSSNNVMPGVTVTLAGPERRVVTTDENGKFAFSALPRGDYELRARLTGFRTVILDVTVPEPDSPLTIAMRLAKQFQIIFVGDTPGDIRRRR